MAITDGLWAAQPTPVIYTREGASGKFTVEGPDSLANRAVVELSDTLREQLRGRLGLPAVSRLPVTFRLRITPEADSPALIEGRLAGKKLSLEIQAEVPPNGELNEQMLYSLVRVMLYEKVLESKESAWEGGRLPELPYWLVEGAVQFLAKARHDDFVRVIKRAYYNHTSPGLPVMMAWRSTPADPVARAWQRVFCYQFFESVTVRPAGAAQLQEWLKKLGSDGPGNESPLPGTLADDRMWASELRRLSGESLDIVYNWEQTVSRLSGLQNMMLVDGTKKTSVMAQVTKLLPVVDHPGLKAALVIKISEYSELELRGHFAWRPVIALYRQGLYSVADPAKRKDYEKLMAEAEKGTKRLMEQGKKVTDYLNWYQVTQDTGVKGTVMRSSFDEMEHLQGRPVRTGDAFEGEIGRGEEVIRDEPGGGS